jgi:hypothetical protein
MERMSMRYATALLVAVLWLLPTACGVNTNDLVGKPLKPLTNAIPGPGEDIHTYCTAYNPDPDLHNHTIAELVAAHKPFILLFGTPAHCTQCQNQIDTVRSYREKYDHAFEVVHIDQYKNGQVYTALGVRGDPWTFLIGADGVVEKIFPGVTTWDDLDGAIRHMLGLDGAKAGAEAGAEAPTADTAAGASA